MPSLPLSPQQLDVLRALREAPRTVIEIRQFAGLDPLPSAAATVLRALNQRGAIAYCGGRGVKLGAGRWRLTTYGTQLLRELGEISSADVRGCE